MYIFMYVFLSNANFEQFLRRKKVNYDFYNKQSHYSKTNFSSKIWGSEVI